MHMEKTPELDRLSHFLAIFNHESERGAALLAGSILDEMLLEILEAYLMTSKSSRELIQGFNAPLGTFSSRAKACHALGLITDIEYEEIDVIKKIRNEFGHSWDIVSFDNNKINELTKRLSWRGPQDAENPINGQKFKMSAAMLVVDLMYRSRLVRKEKIQQRVWWHTLRRESE